MADTGSNGNHQPRRVHHPSDGGDTQGAVPGRPAGTLSPEWAETLGLRPGIPIAMGGFDAHYGAVGSGIRAGTLVKIIGTSTCD